VGPLRAILVARGQELFNQLQREAGGVGLAGAAVVAILIPLALAPPPMGAYITGLRLGGLMAHPLGGAGAALTLSGLLLVIPLSLGFLAGVLGGDGESGLSVRGYPVSRRTRLAAQLLSSSVELPPMLALTCLAGLAAGLCVAQPAAAPIALLLCAQASAWVLIIQRLTRGLRAVGLAQPVFALSALAVIGLLILAGLSRPLFFATGRLFREGLSYSPTTFGALGLVDAASFDLATSGLRQLFPLAVTALAIVMMVRGFSGAEEEARGHRGGNARPERLWSFDTNSHGIAKLFVKAVTHSRHGLIGLFLPPFLAAIVVGVSAAVAEDLARAPPPAFLAKRMPDSLDALPLFGILPFLLVHLDSELWLNQWGWDGRAVRTLFVAPIAVRDLLVGKLMGLATFVAAQYLMTVPLLSLLRPPRVAELLWGLGAGAFALIAMGGLGHVLSAGLSRPLDQRGKINRTESFAAMLAGALVLAAVLAPVVFTYAITRPLGEWGQALGLWALAAVGFAGYRRALPFLGQRVRDMREQFLEAT
jgi:hypothetical protein